MKNVPMILLAVVGFVSTLAAADEGALSSSGVDADSEFLQPGEWWNLFFDNGSDPLNRTVRAVKVVQLSEKHSSWVRIKFPKDRDEHLSIFGPVIKAHDDGASDLHAALAKWEKGIVEWRTMWINLDFVVHASKVERKEERNQE